MRPRQRLCTASKALHLLAAHTFDRLPGELAADYHAALQVAAWCDVEAPPAAVHAAQLAVVPAIDTMLWHCDYCWDDCDYEDRPEDQACRELPDAAACVISLACRPSSRLSHVRQATAACASAEAGLRLLPLLLRARGRRQDPAHAASLGHLAGSCLAAFRAHLDSLHAFLLGRGCGASQEAQGAAAPKQRATPLWGLCTPPAASCCGGWTA